MSDNVVVEKFTREHPFTDMRNLVDCYQDVFSDPPWNEWMKCTECGKYWGAGDKSALQDLQFRHCDEPLVEFWPFQTVLNEILEHLDPLSSHWVARSDGRIIGFCWGYPVSVEDLEDELGISLDGISSLGLDDKSDEVAYQSELGVSSDFRGRKIAKQLFRKRLEDFLDRGMSVGVVRTRKLPEPSVTFLWFTKKLGYKEIASYGSEDGRVVLGRSLHGVREML